MYYIFYTEFLLLQRIIFPIENCPFMRVPFKSLNTYYAFKWIATLNCLSFVDSNLCIAISVSRQ